MVLPATHLSALQLLMAGLICLGSWPNLLKLSLPRQRFEFFYFDFALGSLLLAILAAYTFGTLGSEVSFSDRILVAGRLSQVWLISAGIVFNIGNMLLVAAISLLGISAAFPIAAALLLIIDSIALGGSQSILALTAGIVLLLAAIAANVFAAKLWSPPAAAEPPTKRTRGARPSRLKRSTKGLVTAAAASVIMSPAWFLARKGMTGDLALGPYAGALMFAIGMVISTAVFNFYFLVIPIEGSPLHIASYVRGKFSNHLPGLIAGGVFALGWLLNSLSMSGTAATLPSAQGYEIVSLSAAVLASVWSLVAWKEFSTAPSKARLSIWLAVGFLFAGIVAIAL